MVTAPAALPMSSRTLFARLTLDRFFARCENQSCPTRNNLWPNFRRRSSGVRFRGLWLCGPGCLEQLAAPAFCEIIRTARRWEPKSHRIPLGLHLLSRGVISEAQLRQAVERQRQNGNGRLGDCLQQIGAANEQEITAALASQWACPVFPIEKDRRYLHHANVLPLPLMEAQRLIPVFVSRDRTVVYIAFFEGIDYAALHAVEEILQSRTVPCLISASAFHSSLEEIRQLPRDEHFLFDSVKDPAEMARITASFALQLHANWVQVTGCGEFAWARFHNGTMFRDLLFRLAA